MTKGRWGVLSLLLVVCTCLVGTSPAGASQAEGTRIARARVARLAVHGRSALRRADGVTWLTGGDGLSSASFSRVQSAPLIAELGDVTGTVTAAVAKTPIEGIEVCAISLAEESELEEEAPPVCVETDSTGKYTTSLPAGEYIIEFFAPDLTGPSYVSQFFDDKLTPGEAEPVLVAAHTTRTNVDAALQIGGQIAGTITSATTHGQLAGVVACALGVKARAGRCSGRREDTGIYTIPGLPTGTYKVVFLPQFEEPYGSQYYKEKSTFAAADPVSVTAEMTTSGIDAAMQPIPVALTKPVISGSAVEGQTLTVTQAIWSGSPTSIVDEWGRCTRTAKGEFCEPESEGPRRVLTAEDVGHRIRVRESAFNAGGEGEVLSGPTAIVTNALPVGVAPPVTSLTLPAQGGVSATQSATASIASLKALLARLLAPTGRNAKIAALLKHGGFTFSFHALSAGTTSVSWYLVPRGAHLARVKPVLVASGKVNSTSPGAAMLKVKLTSKGRSLLAHAGQLKLTAKGVLAPKDQAAVSQTKAFTVKR